MFSPPEQEKERVIRNFVNHFKIRSKDKIEKFPGRTGQNFGINIWSSTEPMIKLLLHHFRTHSCENVLRLIDTGFDVSKTNNTDISYETLHKQPIGASMYPADTFPLDIAYAPQ